jgi:hypothetical protein
VLAKAAAYGGAVLAGWYAAQALTILPDVVGARRTRLLLASLAFLAACCVSVAGMVVQALVPAARRTTTRINRATATTRRDEP